MFSGLGCLGPWRFVALPPPFPPPPVAPRCFLLCVFSGLRCLGPWRLIAPPPLFFYLPPPLCLVVSCFACFPASGALGLGVLLPPLPPPPPLFLFPPPPSLRPRCLLLCVFSGLGCLGPWCLVAPPLFLFFFAPPPLSLAFPVFRPGLPWASAPCHPPPFFFPLCFLFFLYPFFFLLFLPVVRCGAGLCVLGRQVCPGVPRRCCLCRWAVCAGWCCVVLPVGAGCPLLSPAGSWCRVSVVLSLSGRSARRPEVWRGVSWCSAALCCVLLRCVVVWWCAVVLCCLFASLPVPVVCFLPLRVCCVCSGVSCCVFPVLSALCGAVLRCAGALSLCCALRLCCFWWLVLLVPGVAAFCWGSAGGSGCPALSFGGVCRLSCPCLVWPSLGVFPVVSCSPVLCPVALCCRVVLCCGALSSFFVFVVAGGAGLLLFPVGSGFLVSVSVLCLCGAVLVCLRRCSLCGASLPFRGWLVFCVVACCVFVFAVGPGCALLSPGGAWWLLVSCLGGVLWCVPGCCAAPCCCALCRQALRCCALCCFGLLRLVLPRAVLCPGALSVVLGSCTFLHRVLCCPLALCVFCCGVSLRGVVRRCALCRVRPWVSFCVFPVVSALCGVVVWPTLPRCPAPLCCAPRCCAAAWCRGVLSCRLVGFVSGVGVVVPTQNFLKCFFPFFLAFENKTKLYTTSTHSRAARPCTLQCLTCYRSFLMFFALYLCVASWSVLASIAKS